jgi:predicted GIY-YIG superfamily endonuclease
MSAELVPPPVAPGKPKKLLEQMRDSLRLKHYSLRTEQSYCAWVERFIRFHHLRHPKDMGADEITKFLTHHARVSNVAAATQTRRVKASLTRQSKTQDDMHYVYVLRSAADDGFYIGYSRNLRRRFAQHTAGVSFATSFRGPWKLIYYEAYLEQADALGRERYLKEWLGQTVSSGAASSLPWAASLK